MDDPYAILGVSRKADADAIKAAYLAMLKKYHPDKAGNDPAGVEKFLQIRAAWESISAQIRSDRVHFDNIQRSQIQKSVHNPIRSVFVSAKAVADSAPTSDGSSKDDPYSAWDYIKYAVQISLIAGFAGLLGLLALVFFG